MAYKISDECISCGSCAAGCPCEAISEGETHYEIDADKCCSCGACAAGFFNRIKKVYQIFKDFKSKNLLKKLFTDRKQIYIKFNSFYVCINGN